MSTIPESQTIPTILTVQDMSSVGRCSLTIMLPLISVLQCQPIPLPTAILSNHLGFGKHKLVDFTDSMSDFITCWEPLKLTFDTINTGFMTSPQQAKLVRSIVERYRTESTTIVIDPVLADHGRLYSIYTPDMVTAMKELVKLATIVTPNYTEACLLTNTPYTATAPTAAELKQLCQQLSQLGPSKVVITSVPHPTMALTVSYDSSINEMIYFSTPKIALQPSGSGDMLAAVLTATYTRTKDFNRSVRQAIIFTYLAIKNTYTQGNYHNQGLVFEPLLSTLGKPDFIQLYQEVLHEVHH